MKDLKDKAIDIKGKKYVLVADRILAFNEEYPEGSITTELLSETTSEHIIIKATVTIGQDQKFTGHSQATVGEGMVNKTAALENCETSAVGRALAMLGIGVLESVASADEMVKAGAVENPKGKICELCGKDAKVSPKSGKLYCPDWKDHKEVGEYANIIDKKDKDFFDSLPEN